MVLPGNLSVTLVSTPDSVARGVLVSFGGEGEERRGGGVYWSLRCGRRVWLGGSSGLALLGGL